MWPAVAGFATAVMELNTFDSRGLRSALAWEQVGGRWFQAFAGVLVMEAAKQIYAGSALRQRPPGKRAFLPMPQGFRRLNRA